MNPDPYGPLLHLLSPEEATHATGYSYPSGVYADPHRHQTRTGAIRPCVYIRRGHCHAYDHLAMITVDLPGTATDELKLLAYPKWPAHGTDTDQAAHEALYGAQTIKRGQSRNVRIQIPDTCARAVLTMLDVDLRELIAIAEDKGLRNSCKRAIDKIRAAAQTPGLPE